MQVPAASLLLTPAATPSGRAVQWWPGQELSARVIGPGPKNFIQLDFGNGRLMARTGLGFTPGEQLQLRVVSTTPAVELKVMTRSTADPAAPLRAALAQTLPRQGSMNDTLSLLRALVPSDRHAPGMRPSGFATAPRAGGAANPLAAAAPLPAALTDRVSRFARELPTVSALREPDALRAQVRDAAQPTEHKLALAAAATPVRTPVLAAAAFDFRALVTVLAATFRQGTPASGRMPVAAPPQTAGTVAARGPLPGVEPQPGRLSTELAEATLARNTAQHLTNVATLSGQTAAPFVIEFPVRHGADVDLWRFEIEQDEPAAQGARRAQRARLRLQLRFSATESLSVEIRCHGEEISIAFDASDCACEAAYAGRSDELARALEQRGLSLAALTFTRLEQQDAAPAFDRPLIEAAV